MKKITSKGYYDRLVQDIKKNERKGNYELIESECYDMENKNQFLNCVDLEKMKKKRFYYISDIHLGHKVILKFKNYKNKPGRTQIFNYIKSLAKNLADYVRRDDYEYLLIAGDTSSKFELSEVFYRELIKNWPAEYIIVVNGNHELLDPYVDMEDNVKKYRKFFAELGITFLQNALFFADYNKGRGKFGYLSENQILKMSFNEIKETIAIYPIVVLGGIGFSGYNKKYNAMNLQYGKTFDDLKEFGETEVLKKDYVESEKFNAIYQKIKKVVPTQRVIILTHTGMENWSNDEYNPHWIYVNGHDHINHLKIDDKATVYADNQIGYKSMGVGLKSFLCDRTYDVFGNYRDGIYKIIKEQYMDYYHGLCIDMTFGSEAEGQIYLLKRNEYNFFLFYGYKDIRAKTKKLYLLKGGDKCNLEKNTKEDIEFYYRNLQLFTTNVCKIMKKYMKYQKSISNNIKQLNGSGKIHGAIIDVDNMYIGLSLCHLYINPYDGKITPYYAEDKGSRHVYKNFEMMIKNHIECKYVLEEYKKLKKISVKENKRLPKCFIEDSFDANITDEWVQNEDKIYRLSNQILNMQYCVNKKVVRFWKTEILNWNESEKIEGRFLEG